VRIRKEILEYAERAVCQDRNANYGDPRSDFSHTAAFWSEILDVEVQPHQVALCLMAVKISRLLHNPQHADGWADIAGYAACGADVADADTEALGSEYTGAPEPEWGIGSDVEFGSPSIVQSG
jgi:hypothetical protein